MSLVIWGKLFFRGGAGPLTVKSWVNLTTWRNIRQDAPGLTVGSITVILTLKVARRIIDEAQLPPIKLGGRSSSVADQARRLILPIQTPQAQNFALEDPLVTRIQSNRVFHPAAMNHEGPIIKTEPNMSNEPTPNNTPRQVHLDFVLYATNKS
ncbi:hypothetical protein PCANC_08465 [Puccinia coronata f. sp. avenae]|uniref:Uncharacterized protein n=1 Tax=Puccinia coronata f. sp. avenae TaxID=200324 RepID=A0A2N5T4A2_9BASI|nr:hypothetical protein PCANC_08465 [Puccinia coronata f. sp. avenae]